MSGYVKIWTDIRNDEWFIGLKLNERGLWYELLVIAKMRGDSGRFSMRNPTALAQEVGGDRSSVDRILMAFHTSGKIILTKSSTGQIEITIPNYIYWQDLTKDGIKAKVVENRRKTTGKTPLPDQTRPDQSKPDQTNKQAPSAPTQILDKETREKMLGEISTAFGLNGQSKKELCFGDYMLAVRDWLSGVYPTADANALKVVAGNITKSIARNAFGKPEQYNKSWPPIITFTEFLNQAIGEPAGSGGLLAGRNFPPKPTDMIRFMNQVFTDGQQTHEYAHAAYHKAGLV